MPPPAFKNVHLLDHPFALSALAHLRDKRTPSPEFRERVRELAKYLVLEATKDLPLKQIEIETPLAACAGFQLDLTAPIVVAPILRAGLGMVEPIMELLPEAQIRHIGLKRNEETLMPESYYVKLPDRFDAGTIVLIVDPMLATGGSAVEAVRLFSDRGVRQIKFLSLIAAPEGIQHFQASFPDVQIFTVAIDERLNEQGYIVPGLGDAGDRIFGTTD